MSSTTAVAEGVSPERATPAEVTEAQAAYTDGVKQFEAKRYAQAARAFERSLAVVASPNARLMLARALREAGDHQAAFEQMSQTQRDAGHLAERMPKYGGTAESAEVELKELRPRVASLSIEVTGGNAIEVWVGQRKVPQTLWRGVAVKPGLVHVVARLPGGRRAWQAIQVKLGEHRAVTLDLTTAEEGPTDVVPWLAKPQSSSEPRGSESLEPPSATEPPVRDSASKPPLPYRELSYISAGVGGVGLLTFGIAGLMSQGTHGELEDNCGGGVCPAGSEGLIDRGKREQTIANIGLGVGLIGLSGAVVFYFLDQDAKSRSSGKAKPRGQSLRGLSVGPRFVTYGGSF